MFAPTDAAFKKFCDERDFSKTQVGNRFAVVHKECCSDACTRVAADWACEARSRRQSLNKLREKGWLSRI